MNRSVKVEFSHEGYANAAEIPVGPYDIDLTIPKNPTAKATPACFSGLTAGVSSQTGASWHAESAPESAAHFYDPNAALPTDPCLGHPSMQQQHCNGDSYTSSRTNTPYSVGCLRATLGTMSHDMTTHSFSHRGPKARHTAGPSSRLQ
ncbi:MAG: hypothetical protein WCK41_06495 [Actinomycetes bacterium]